MDAGQRAALPASFSPDDLLKENASWNRLVQFGRAASQVSPHSSYANLAALPSLNHTPFTVRVIIEKEPVGRLLTDIPPLLLALLFAW